MDQYPDVTEEDVDRIIKRDYAAEDHGAIHEMIRGIEVREKTRIVMACLKNGKGDLGKLKGELANAEGWWREILGEAEYPNYTKKMFHIEKLSEVERQRITEKDKNQYLAWLKGSDAGGPSTKA